VATAQNVGMSEAVRIKYGGVSRNIRDEKQFVHESFVACKVYNNGPQLRLALHPATVQNERTVSPVKKNQTLRRPSWGPSYKPRRDIIKTLTSVFL
jgi:hypothetical protein